MRFLSILILTFLTLSFTNCSEDQNGFKDIFVDEGQKDAIDHILSEAQFEYDDGNYDEALKIADEVLAINPNNEEAILLKGYVYLAKGGIGTFELAEKLIDLSEDDDETNLRFASSSSNEAGDFLDDLGSLIADNEDIDKMYLDPNEIDYENTKIKGSEYGDGNIKFPKKASIAREDANFLENINDAIEIICPFVNEAAKVITSTESSEIDDRHLTTKCPPYTGTKRSPGKIHFLWALAHLGEAIAFNYVIFPSVTTITNKVTDIENDAPSQGQLNVTQLTKYINDIGELSAVVDAIFPTGETAEKDAMLTAIFNNLTAVGNGFGQMPGIPKEVTESIDDALSKLKETKDSLKKKITDNAGSAESVSGASALKDQFFEDVAKKVGDKLEANTTELNKSGNETQKKEACDAYKSLTSVPISICP